jgi:OmcA/MtrC family decaheme c-type cytochrome
LECDEEPVVSGLKNTPAGTAAFNNPVGETKMASFMNRASRIASLVLFGLFLAGCEGNDGADGEPGPVGPPGPPGPPGPSTGGGVPIDSAERINIAVTAIDVPDGGGKPVVSLTLTNDLNQGLAGLPAEDINFVLSQLTPGSAGSSSEWQSYKTREDGGVPDVQATTENGAEGDFEDTGDGTYTYEFASALTDYPAGPEFDANKVHRLGIEIRGQAPNSSNGIYTFIAATGAPVADDVDTRRIVDNDTCNACHDRLEFHGGPRTDVDYCVTCHNPSSTDGNTGNTVDMKALIHNIHAGRDGYVIVGYGDREHDYTDVEWTQDPRNCQTCHEESDENTPQASNWRLVPSRAACGTCHYDDGVPGNGNDFAIEDGVHPGLVFTDDTQCVNCHGPEATISGGALQVARVHEIPEQIASGEFEYRVLGIANAAAGQAPEVTFSVVNPGDPDDPDDPVDVPYDLATDPAWTACDGTSRLAVTLAWATTPDYTNTGTGSSPAQPVSMNPLTACGGTATDNGDGTYTVTSPVPVPAGVAGTLSAGLEGHPWVDIDGDGASGFNERISVKNAIAYQGIDGAETVERRNAIAIERCDQCHNVLSIHGNNRTDEPEVCVQCHNPNATDVNVRNSPCSDEIGTDDATIDFKRMIHLIHASGATEVPYEVCGFGNSTHVYDVTYPGHLNNCEGCHEPDGYYPVEPGAILGTTVDVGADPASPIDDVVISPNSSVCSSCHVSDLAKTHMEQNGGDFAATKAADSTLISSGVESCALCHGPGRSADVKEVHGVSGFQFN